MAQANKKPAAKSKVNASKPKPAPVTLDKVYGAILESERNMRREADTHKAELNREIGKLQAHLHKIETRMDQRFDSQDNKMDSHHKWATGLIVIILLAVAGPYLGSLV